MTYKALYDLDPGYLKESLSLPSTAMPLKSSDEHLLPIPLLIEVHLGVTREQAFSIVTPSLWNAIPSEAHPAPSVATFQ